METSTINRNRRYVMDRRTGKDRRAISCYGYYPERRSTNDRRFVYFRRYK